MRKKTILLCLLALTFLNATSAWAAKLIMKDGTTLEGTVIPQEDGYWIHLLDGSTKIVPGSSVSKFVPDASTNAPSSNPESNAMLAFRQAQNQAAATKSASDAVAIWETFVDKYPKSSDIDKAKAELAKWRKMAADGAEKINDKWVTGDDLKQIHAQAKSLLDDAYADLKSHQTLAAVDKLKQCVKIYPNSFDAQYLLGDSAVLVDNDKDALKYYQQAVLLDPKSPEALNNLGVANFFQHNLDTSAQDIYKACKLSDDKDIVQNLASVLAHDDTLRSNPRNKQMADDLKLLEATSGVSGPADKLIYLLYTDTHDAVADVGPSGAMAATGSGCFITANGLILTNRHVATGLEKMTDKPDPNVKVSLTVYMNGKSDPIPATFVAADDVYDLALLKVNLDHPVQFVHFSPSPKPQQGADCTVLGFPLGDLLGMQLKVTRGIVSVVFDSGDGSGADILTDAKVNPGNSGGPIVDKYGNLIALTRMKTYSSEEEGVESYGGGISVEHIREFLEKQNVNATVGKDSKEMSTEDIVTEMKPATVFILMKMAKATP